MMAFGDVAQWQEDQRRCRELMAELTSGKMDTSEQGIDTTALTIADCVRRIAILDDLIAQHSKGT